MSPAEPPRTSRHFAVGAAVHHKTHGFGVIMARANGERYPYFAHAKVTGTAMTRVRPVEGVSRIPNDLKTYRASRTIAGEHKNCGFCRDRISVGMPVQFVPGRGCWHVGCVELVRTHAEGDEEVGESHPRPDVLPSPPALSVRLSAGGATFEIVDDATGEVATDPVEGLPLDGIASFAKADRIASRLRAF